MNSSAPPVCSARENPAVDPGACAVFHGLPDGVVIHDGADHSVVAINPRLAEWIETDLPRGDVFELFLHDSRAAIRAEFVGDEVVTTAPRRLARGTRTRWVTLRSRRTRLGDRPVWVTTLRDVTDAASTVRVDDAGGDRLALAERRRIDTVSALGHELRNPINGILGVSSVLMQSSLSAEDREYVETIHQTAEGLVGLLGEVLDLSRLERGETRLEESAFSLRDVCETSVNRIRASVGNGGLDVRFECDDAVPAHAVGDAGRIGQVVSNLLANATTFTHEGHVILRLDLEDRRAERFRARFTVEDTGIGFDAETVERVFEPFVHARGSSGSAYGGTGLGLTLGQQLVRHMGSVIEVESTVGEGSRFSFAIDLGIGPDTVPESQQEGDVLFVGSAGPRRKAFVEALRASGHRIETCESSVDAIDRVRVRRAEGKPYLEIYVEKRLPDLDGETLARSLRQQLGEQMVRMVLVVDGDTAAASEHARRSGFDAILADPSEIAEASVPREPAPDATTPPEGHSMKTPRVLVIEDNPVNQKVVCHMLRKMGFTVELAGDGRQGVDRLNDETPFDLVLMDCQMPVMDGYEATRTIRALEPPRSAVPIVALTANAMDGDREKCLAAGMDDYLSKPAKADQLRDMLAKWIPACDERIAQGV